MSDHADALDAVQWLVQTGNLDILIDRLTIQLVQQIGPVLQERNAIERAKLAEMRAARNQSFFFSHCGQAAPMFVTRTAEVADSLTAAALGEQEAGK